MIKPIIILENSNNRIHSRYDEGNTASFKATVQDLKRMNNNNGRTYDRNDYMKALDDVYSKVDSGRFLGELDHPVKYMDNPYRLFTVAYEDASHIFTKLYLEGDYVIGEGYTLPTPKGRILKDLILNPHVNVGFSLRADGDEIRKRNTTLVRNLKIITYDAVVDPSHKESTILEYSTLFESTVNHLYNKDKQRLLIASDPTSVEYFEKRMLTFLLSRNLKYWFGG